MFWQKYKFTQALYKLPEDDRKPKYVEAIIMCILV